jgi:hypothetical protein
MRKILAAIGFALVTSALFAQPENNIYLLVRADDIGSFHSANVACIESYKNGIARSVELMAPCAWFGRTIISHPIVQS